jgi:hypothetical protein
LGDLRSEHDIENRIALLTFDRLTGDWSDVAVYFVECAQSSQIESTVIDGTGSHQGPPADGDSYSAWEELRHEMTDPLKGTWYSAFLLLSKTGQYRFVYNYDDRPSWPVEVGMDGSLVRSLPISASALVEDAQAFPRAAEYEPEWMTGIREKSAQIVLADPDWDDQWQQLVENQGWGIVDATLQTEIKSLVLDDVLDPGEAQALARQVFTQIVSSTAGNQMRYLARAAMGLGLVEEYGLPSGDLTADSWDLLEESSEFARMLEMLVPVFTELTERRIRAQTRQR